MALSLTTRQTHGQAEGWESGFSGPTPCTPSWVGPWEPTEALLLACVQDRATGPTAEDFHVMGAERHLDGLTLSTPVPLPQVCGV